MLRLDMMSIAIRVEKEFGYRFWALSKCRLQVREFAMYAQIFINRQEPLVHYRLCSILCNYALTLLAAATNVRNPQRLPEKCRYFRNRRSMKLLKTDEFKFIRWYKKTHSNRPVATVAMKKCEGCGVSLINKYTMIISLLSRNWSRPCSLP